jgi:tRNA (mo5U34)-methyltransferase
MAGGFHEQEELKRRIEALGPWFHNLRIGGLQTAPDHFLGDYPAFKWRVFQNALPEDLRGCSVLDIGCNAGFYAMEMKRRNAGRVLGIDADPRYLAQARFAAQHEGLDVEFAQLSVYDIAQLGERFDLVLFMGVLYHLRHPLLALDLLHEHAVGDQMVFQCMLRGPDETRDFVKDHPFTDTDIFEDPAYPTFYFVEHRYAGDPTNWFIPNRAGVEALLRSAGFIITARPESEVYILRRGERPPFVGPPLRVAEHEAGTGLPRRQSQLPGPG